jgi:hypothetical protein
VIRMQVVRGLLWDGLAVTEASESVYLTPSGWAAGPEVS